MSADLHCHSTMSDGVLAPEDVARRAHDNGVTLWALTDHDILDGVPAARAQAQALGMRFIAGVEISVTWAGHTVHVVGLNVDDTHTGLVEGLRSIRVGRSERAEEMGRRLDAMGVENSYQGALAYVSNPALISRTHFARYLVEKGYCANLSEVFKRYLGEDSQAYVPMQWSTLEQAVNWILQAGGRAVIAHPGRYNYTPVQFDALFTQFRELGGEAIEVVTGSHAPHQYREYADVARQYGFLASCGSDFHGPDENRLDLGRLPAMPDDLTPVWHDWV
ncbi:3',5'-nucleoside bisphosphate phosphatase [Achromobacter sp. F4_2707]|uniref:3',5'-nucleoside bisphosphate phosphatase n=1 Tax=Achromobacter sp. F4_2707 TaxID=3114286 RepID=UPI0039C5D554